MSNTSTAESIRKSDVNAKLLALFRAESKYTAELWTILQELRLWAAVEGIALPDFAKPNRTLYIDRFDEVNDRHTAAENFLSGRNTDVRSLELH
ncbi:hypothetical protein [Pararobbsia alpina]|uniref:Uncharacterized protein n=1 Tax=Pararobbsia alpina TaxID=621374 RepID=A0A6S7BAA2_9BURK|nr:hypothetical protein [Pararobbsia alpina]CAB3784234.1 hypothetical protein LMG28138_01768 [Pararobbsia alpina]